MLTAICALALLQNSTVSVDQIAARLDILLEKLSAQSGQKLTCTPNFLDDYVVARFKNEPLEDVKDKLADITDGRWAAREGGAVLTAKPRPAQSSEARERILRQSIRAAQPTREFDLAAATDLYDRLESAWAKTRPGQIFDSRPFVAETPGTRAAARLALALGPEVLANLPEGVQVIFSSEPTSLQRPLPDAAYGVLEQYKKELAAQGAVSQARLPVPHASLGYLYPRPDQVREPGVVWVVAQRLNVVSLQVQGFLWGSAPEEKGQPLPTLISGQFACDEMPSAPERAVPSFEGELQMSNPAREWQDWRNWIAGRPGAVRPVGLAKDQPLWQIITGQDERDYLAFQPSEALIQWSQKEGRPLLALLTDSELYSYSSEVPQLADAVESAIMGGRLKEDDKWLLIQPVDLWQTRDQRLSRRAIYTALQEVEPGGEFKIGHLLTAAEFCKTASQYGAALDWAWKAGARHPGSHRQVSGPSSLWAGHLPPVLRSRLINDGALDVDLQELPKTYQNMVFQDLLQIQFDSKQEGGLRPGSLQLRPSWLLAQPSSRPIRLRFTLRHENRFRSASTEGGRSPGQGGDLTYYSLSSIASFEAQKKFRMEQGLPAEPGSRRVYALEPVALIDIACLSGEVAAANFSHIFPLRPHGQDYVAPEQFSGELAEEYRAALDAAYQKLRSGRGS